MTLSKPAWSVVALGVAATFFWVAIRPDVDYATSPPSMARRLFGPEAVIFAHPWWLALHVWVRKAYSVVAFGLVGWSAHHALPASSRPVRRAAILVAGYSLGIEIAQRLLIGPEPLLESILDVGCGALGGALAIGANRLSVSTKQRRAETPRAATVTGESVGNASG